MTTIVAPPATVKPFREDLGNGEMRLNFHAAHTRGWQSKARFVCMLMAAQTGKTVFGPHWLDREMQEKGPGDYLAVTATFPLLRLKMLPELQLVFETLLKWGEYKAGDKLLESFERHHGAPAWRIIIFSAQNPESLESATAKAAWLDEAGQHQFPRQAWEAVNRRVLIARGRILITSTPYEFNWFKQEIYDRWRAGDPDYDVIQADSLVNPAFPREEYERARATLPSWKFNLFYRAEFERPAGLIYDSFDEDICSIPRFELDPKWPRYVGHDFGTNNMAAVWIARDPGTRYLYVYRTYLAGGMEAFEHAQKFKKLSEGELIIKRVGGAKGANEDGWRQAFRSAGWPIAEPRERSVSVGIDSVYAYHNQNKLFVFQDLHAYLDEKRTYSWKLDDNYQPTSEIDQKSKFHQLDAERYAICDLGPERALGVGKSTVIQKFGHALTAGRHRRRGGNHAA